MVLCNSNIAKSNICRKDWSWFLAQGAHCCAQSRSLQSAIISRELKTDCCTIIPLSRHFKFNFDVVLKWRLCAAPFIFSETWEYKRLLSNSLSPALQTSADISPFVNQKGFATNAIKSLCCYKSVCKRNLFIAFQIPRAHKSVNKVYICIALICCCKSIAVREEEVLIAII